MEIFFAAIKPRPLRMSKKSSTFAAEKNTGYELFTGIIGYYLPAFGGSGPRMRVDDHCVSAHFMRLDPRRNRSIDHLEQKQLRTCLFTQFSLIVLGFY